MLKMGFSNEAGGKVAKAPFEKLTKKFAEVLKTKLEKNLSKRTGLVDLVIVNDDAMQEMNLEYRDKDSPTDVITFAYLEVTAFEKGKGNVIVGDVFISIDTAKKQAKQKKHSLEKEMAILYVHGLLHCFGFKHKTAKQEADMEKWATKVMNNYST